VKRSPRQRGIFGIRIRVHYTCAVAFVLMAAIVSTQLPESYSLWQKAVLGVSTASLFFVLLVVREFVLNLTTSRRHSPVKDVALFPFGGVSQTTVELTLPNHELLMAAARLLSSLITAAVLYGIYALLVDSGNLTIAGVVEWLAFIWFSFFLLHFLPGFPLDAGMALRALLLKQSGNYYRATFAASTVGWALGFLIIFGGVLTFIITQQWLVGLVVTGTGWCLQSASAVIRRQAVLAKSLESTSARDIMTGEYTVIDPNITIGQLFREHILVSGWGYFVITDGPILQGVLTVNNLKSVPWKRWSSTRVGDIMVPANEIETARPGQSGAIVLQEMDRLRINDIPVLEDGKVVGIINRDRLVNLGKTRAEFGS
jgi:CBS domain-containing protein